MYLVWKCDWCIRSCSTKRKKETKRKKRKKKRKVEEEGRWLLKKNVKKWILRTRDPLKKDTKGTQKSSEHAKQGAHNRSTRPPQNTKAKTTREGERERGGDFWGVWPYWEEFQTLAELLDKLVATHSHVNMDAHRHAILSIMNSAVLSPSSFREPACTLGSPLSLALLPTRWWLVSHGSDFHANSNSRELELNKLK